VHDPFDVRALDGSALALRGLALEPGTTAPLGEPEHDTLLYVGRGAGTLSIADDSAPVGARSAGLVLAGEEAVLNVAEELEAVVATVAPSTDLHAPMGHRDLVTSLDDADAQAATGSRSFQILFGPHNGSTRATFFAGFIPPGKAPWHYHLYDEIVWVLRGEGRVHIGDTVETLAPGSAFRLHAREVHIVENTHPAEELAVLGVFTPAGSPSAAYLTADVAASYTIAG